MYTFFGEDASACIHTIGLERNYEGQNPACPKLSTAYPEGRYKVFVDAGGTFQRISSDGPAAGQPFPRISCDRCDPARSFPRTSSYRCGQILGFHSAFRPVQWLQIGMKSCLAIGA